MLVKIARIRSRIKLNVKKSEHKASLKRVTGNKEINEKIE